MYSLTTTKTINSHLFSMSNTTRFVIAVQIMLVIRLEKMGGAVAYFGASIPQILGKRNHNLKRVRSTSTDHQATSNIRAEWLENPVKTITNEISSNDDKVVNHAASIMLPRSGHVSFTIGNDQYLFGGYAEEKNDVNMSRYPTNDLWKRTSTTNVGNGLGLSPWKRLEQKGDCPEERLVSAITVLKGRYVFTDLSLFTSNNF